jgi:AAA family ATP:ADP antiporter
VSAPTPSLLARVLARLAPIEPHETAAVIAAFCLFFFMWGGYFAVRPVRETIGTILGRDQVADLWIMVWIGSLLIIPLYGVIVARCKRSTFLPWTYAVVAVVLATIAAALQGGTIEPVIGKFFYVFISVLNLFLISMFWSFLLELFESGQTKRLFGVIAAGGSAGALAGPLVSDLTVGWIGNSGVMLFGAVLFVAAIFCQRVLLRIWSERSVAPAALHGRDDRPIGGSVFAGVTLIVRSPYLLTIALFVVLISTVSTFLYFEQLRLVEVTFPDITERTRVFARLDWIVQSLTVLSQIFLTGRIAARFGVTALLTAVPALMILGFLGLALNGSFTVLAVVFVLRRACEYAFIRPGREMLWSPLATEVKYKAKNTIDVPVYRGADALAAQLSNAIAMAGFTTAGIALLGAAVAAVWGITGWSLGRRFERIAGAHNDAASVARASASGQ